MGRNCRKLFIFSAYTAKFVSYKLIYHEFSCDQLLYKICNSSLYGYFCLQFVLLSFLVIYDKFMFLALHMHIWTHITSSTICFQKTMVKPLKCRKLLPNLVESAKESWNRRGELSQYFVRCCLTILFPFRMNYLVNKVIQNDTSLLLITFLVIA